ncbi:MAG: hypothetical protein ABI831_24965 [Betaproteobacteria bacterium]
MLPVTLIAGGLIWLLFNLEWIPSFDWVITLVLAGAGVAILALEGITKKSVIGGPLLIALGVIWLLHFHFGVRWRFLAPGLAIVAGLLMLLARMPAIPEARPPASRPDSTTE